MSATPAGAALPGRDGRIAFTSDHELTGCGDHSCGVGIVRLYTIRPNGRGQRPATACAHDDTFCEDQAAAWSPDGGRLAFDQNQELWVMNADGSGAHHIAGAYGTEPAWSPDGRRLVFAYHRRTGDQVIATVHADGSGRRVLTRGGHWDSQPSWSSRGLIAYTHDVPDAAHSSIETIRPDGRHVARITPATGATNPDFSPDGNLIAFETASGSLDVARSDGSHGRRLNRDGSDPAWSPSGRSIAFTRFVRNPDGRFYSEILIARRDGGGVHRVPYDRSLRHREVDPTGDYYGPSWQPLPR